MIITANRPLQTWVSRIDQFTICYRVPGNEIRELRHNRDENRRAYVCPRPSSFCSSTLPTHRPRGPPREGGPMARFRPGRRNRAPTVIEENTQNAKHENPAIARLHRFWVCLAIRRLRQRRQSCLQIDQEK
jgi:hypothetical protein